MPTLKDVVAAFVAARECDVSTLSRLDFWVAELGPRDLTEITPDDVDAAVVHLASRGRLRPLRGRATVATGKPLAGSTINRYISQLGSLYKYARRLRLIPRTYVFPTANIEKLPEPVDPESYLRPEEVQRILAVARVLDRRWGKLSALVVLAYHTGLRKSNLLNLTWADVDLIAGTATVSRTKNGEPIVAALSKRSVAELKKLPGKQPDELIFAGRTGRPMHFRALWNKVVIEAGLAGRNFHQLRHGCGHALATAGVNQAQIMALMGHKTLSASARYMHHNTRDKAEIVAKVFDREG
ncbi:tyrosine-type recombinase/integrase [Thiosocius teredinicola]|uniref:tyrosine-type recombinase/integrase n=1 Tax=Thiosocius teredinicola TaxID=1973002 RepID=UPI000990A4B9